MEIFVMISASHTSHDNNNILYKAWLTIMCFMVPISVCFLNIPTQEKRT